MSRPEGMSRPVGTAIQAKPSTDMICGMIRSESMSGLVGTAMQAKPGTNIACGMIRPEGLSRTVSLAMRNNQAGHGYEPPRRHEPPSGHDHLGQAEHGHDLWHDPL
jgi:hypothetical protein